MDILPTTARDSSILSDAVSEYNKVRTCGDIGTICHAAENSMYFARDGLVQACCYGREAPIGKYPEQSLIEIWNGSSVKLMRSALRDNILPHGCDLCASQLVSRNFSGLLASRFDIYARPTSPEICGTGVPADGYVRFPSKLEFELSNTCNLECTMCNGFFSSTIRMNREKLPPLKDAYGDEFVEQLLPFLPHLKHASFIGGEPFLIDVYYKIWDHLMELNPTCSVSITTNGSVYTSRVRRVIEKLNCHINVSLDSVVKSTYESIRVHAKFERTMEHLDAFIEVNKKHHQPISISVCPMVTNCREMPGLIEFANRRGIRVFFNTVDRPPELSIASMTWRDKLEIIALYRATPVSGSNEIEEHNYRALRDVSNQIEFWITPKEREQIQLKESASRESLPPPVFVLLNDLMLAPGDFQQQNSEFLGMYIQDAYRAYVEAAWTIGQYMTDQGYLSGCNFDNAMLKRYLDDISNASDPRYSRQALTIARNNPAEFIRICGQIYASDEWETWTDARIVELAGREHLSPQVSIMLNDLMRTSESVEEQNCEFSGMDIDSAYLAYIDAAWTIGKMLSGDLLMPGYEFDDAKLQAYRQYLTETTRSADSRRALHLARTSPKGVIRTYGKLSASEIIAIHDQYFRN